MEPMGTFWNSTLSRCPKNTYKNFTGPCDSEDECCVPCPTGTVTALDGTVNPNDCYRKLKITKSQK